LHHRPPLSSARIHSNCSFIQCRRHRGRPHRPSVADRPAFEGHKFPTISLVRAMLYAALLPNHATPHTRKRLRSSHARACPSLGQGMNAWSVGMAESDTEADDADPRRTRANIGAALDGLWSSARYDLLLTDAEFWSLTPRQFHALLHRHKSRLERDNYFVGWLLQ